ncbi:MAG: hypothetical protein A3G34_03590 [Candidatus Lindowbacteria bacterium RIFCSPLOWO2_12_FULL_62_27]|nr:MAG: hypothetical protein A3G34_03590 [Candidatus Lindowbacteria bacterium RIFCSPLOWO2_12_FULL_62_27]
MFSRFLLLICCLTAALSSFARPAHAAVADDLQFAAALFNDGEYRQALDEFKRLQPALTGAEWEDDVLFWMAECHFYLREYSQASEIYQKIISDHPAFSRVEDAYVKLMGVHYTVGRFERVLELAESFSRKFPASASRDQVYLSWIQSALRLRQFTRAEELLDAYQKASPGSPYVWSLKSILANFYLKEQRFDRALPVFEELYTYQKDENFLLWIGECRFQTGAWAGARDAFSQFLQTQPGNEVARFKLALADYRAGNFAQAVESFKPIADKEGAYTEDALYFLAQALLRTGNADEAKKSLSAILQMRPNEELRKRALALIVQIDSADNKADLDRLIANLEKLGDAGSPDQLRQYRVLSAYRKKEYSAVVALLGQPKDRREWLMLAESFYALGSYPDASRAYAQVLSASAAPAEKRAAHAGLAWSAYAQEQFEDALKYFQAWLSGPKKPEDAAAEADVSHAMAQCAINLGRTEDAIAFYERARKESADRDKITRNMGILYFNSGDYARAVELLDPIADNDQILSIVGRACLYLKQAQKALSYFKKLRRPDLYSLEIGAVHYELGQLEEAKTYFEQAAASQSGSAVGINIDGLLGNIAYKQGNFVEAASRLRKAQLRDPDNIEIRFELAAALMKVENAPRQELVEILRSIATNPRSPAAYRDKARVWLIRMAPAADVSEIQQIEGAIDRSAAFEAQANRLFSQQQYDSAADWYEKLIAIPSLPAETRMQALYGLGWSLHKLGRKQRAQETFRSLLAEFPKSSYAAEIVLLLVEDAYGAQRYEEAANLAIKNMGRISKNVARLRFMAAESLYEIGRYADALVHYKAFLPEADNLADYARYRSGLASFHLKQYEAAVLFFTPIADSAMVASKHYYLGMAQYHLGRKKKAAEHFESLLELGPGDFQEEAWKNFVILIEEVGLWSRAIALGTRLSESPRELDRLVYCKALAQTGSSMAARYCEKLGYIARDPEIAPEALYVAATALAKSDPDKAKQLLEKLIVKFPKCRFVPDAKKFLGKPQ